MRFIEKVKILVGEAGGNRKQISIQAELTPTALTNVINRDGTFTIDKAGKLARRLGVSLDWLADETSGMPAERREWPRYHQLLSDAAREKLNHLAEQHGGIELCLAAAVEYFVQMDLATQAVPISTARVEKHRIETEKRNAFHKLIGLKNVEKNGGAKRRKKKRAAA